MIKQIYKHKEISGLDIGLYLLIFFVSVLTICTLAWIFRLPILGIYIIIGFAITTGFAFLFYEKLQALKLVLIVLGIICFTVVFSGLFIDVTWDANLYFKPSIHMVSQGINPIYESFEEAVLRGVAETYHISPAFWLYLYPKGHFLVASAMNLLMGNIEYAKFINPLSMIALIFVAYTLLKDLFKLKIWQTAMCAFTLAINPLFLTQVTNFYIDVTLGSMIFILILAIIYLVINHNNGVYAKRCWVLIFLTVVIGLNLKLSGGLFFAIFIAPFYFYLMFIYFKNSDKKAMLRITGFFAACVIFAIGFFGFPTYVVNTVRSGSFIYAIRGGDAVTNWVTDGSIPVGLRGEPLWSQFFHSIFTESTTSTWGRGVIKTPFTITDNDRMLMSIEGELRTAGWGIFYSGIFLLSLIVIIIYLVKASSSKTLLFWLTGAIMFLIFAPIPLIPGLFQARYYPHMLLLPTIALIILFCNWNELIKTKKVKKYEKIYKVIIPISLFVLIFFNSYPQLRAIYPRIQASNQMQIDLNNFIQKYEIAEVPIWVNFNRQMNDPFIFPGIFVNMIDAGITNFIYTTSLRQDEFEGRLFFMELWGSFATIGYRFAADYNSIFIDFLNDSFNEDNIIVMSVRDEAIVSLDETVQETMYSLGLNKISMGILNDSYAAIIDGHNVIFESISDEEIVHSQIIEDFEIEIISAGIHVGNVSSIQINGIEHSLNRRGINIVVIDRTTGMVIDSVTFDAWHELNLFHR